MTGSDLITAKELAEMDISDTPLLTQGAEARLYCCTFKGTEAVLKERFCKQYRHPDLDHLIRKERLKAESRALLRCSKFGIPAPALLAFDVASGRLLMRQLVGMVTAREFIDRRLRECGGSCRQLQLLAEQLGRLVARMHNHSLIHGDLTTSNMMVAKEAANTVCRPPCARQNHGAATSASMTSSSPGDCDQSEHSDSDSEPSLLVHTAGDTPVADDDTEADMAACVAAESTAVGTGADDTSRAAADHRRCPTVALLDFGLSCVSESTEAAAVDLHVLERALTSTHGAVAPLVAVLMAQYEASASAGQAVLRRLEQVRQRGRKRSMVG